MLVYNVGCAEMLTKWCKQVGCHCIALGGFVLLEMFYLCRLNSIFQTDEFFFFPLNQKGSVTGFTSLHWCVSEEETVFYKPDGKSFSCPVWWLRKVISLQATNLSRTYNAIDSELRTAENQSVQLSKAHNLFQEKNLPAFIWMALAESENEISSVQTS